MHKFSEFSMDYKKLKISDIIDKEVEFHAYSIIQSKYPKNNDPYCVKLTIKINGETFVVFSGSKVLRSQCEKYQDKFPFIGTIIRSSNKLTFS